MEKVSGRKSAPSMVNTIHDIENDQNHLTGPSLPQTPKSTPSQPRLTVQQDDFYKSKGLWNDIKTLRWMRIPSSSFKLLVGPIVLYAVLAAFSVQPNPFEPMLFISYPIAGSSPDDMRYAKGWLDIVFVLYHVVVFSFIRQFAILDIILPFARRQGIKKQARLDRFGEQSYAMFYYGVMGVWGTFIMATLPTWWYQSENYFIGYPFWEMKPQLKRYYLMHLAYWIQQLLVLALRIEKPRKDFKELVVHHFVSLWLIGWSYGVNMTLMGNGVFVSMDIPDTFLASSLLCHYLKLERTKILSFVAFFAFWSYFRIWLNIRILYSIWTEFDLIPDAARKWSPSDGVWMVWWMRYQMFVPVLLLLFLNIFWYFLMVRIAARAISGGGVNDDREVDEEDEKEA